MRSIFFFCVVFLCTYVCISLAESPVYFADLNLQAAVETELGFSDPTPSDMLGLTELGASNLGITDLTGLEYATNLTSLTLYSNNISDISALSGLTDLESLNLDNNQCSNISALSGLTRLTYLSLHYNNISNLSALSGLTNLRDLWIYENNISNISALSGLTNLTALGLNNNHISNISALAGMVHLKGLYLFGNSISNISTLSGLTDLKWLRLHSNQISDISALTGLTKLTRLDLYANPLNEEACSIYIPQIITNNPGIDIRHDPCASEHSLTISSTSGGTVTTPGEGSFGPYSYGTNVNLVALADSGYRFVSWTGHVGTLSDRYDPTTTIRMHGDYSIMANFAVDDTCTLTLSSTRGGGVTTPGEGDFSYPCGEMVTLKAQADPLFRFDHWSGQSFGVDKQITIPVDGDGAMTAHFMSTLDIIYVDDDGPYDSVPYDASAGDPMENGTSEHPFDSIQEAIEVAKEGAVIRVRGGRYYENIKFLGKGITVQGIGYDKDDPNLPLDVVIDANGFGTAIRCDHQEDANCVLSHLVITGGSGVKAGGIYCDGSHPVLRNCLIVGNRVQPPGDGGGAVYASHSDARFVNCTFSDNYGGKHGAGLYFTDSSIVVTNSIVTNNVPEDVMTAGSDMSRLDDFNFLGYLVDSDPLFNYHGYWLHFILDVVAGPQDPMAMWIDGDYHLQSAGGRWNPNTLMWEMDNRTSPCIDAGHPLSSVGDEPVPNGGLVNQGAYGRTSQASKTAGF